MTEREISHCSCGKPPSSPACLQDSGNSVNNQKEQVPLGSQCLLPKSTRMKFYAPMQNDSEVNIEKKMCTEESVNIMIKMTDASPKLDLLNMKTLCHVCNSDCGIGFRQMDRTQ